MGSYSTRFEFRPPAAELKLCVIVPAKNEASGINDTLTALYHQVDPQGLPIRRQYYEVLVFANNCTDATAQIAQQFAVDHPDGAFHVFEDSLPPDQAHIGYVRRVLMDEAYHRLCTVHRPRGIIASTDGDTTVGPTWVYHTIQAIEQGADVVGGRIVAEPQPTGRYYHLQDVSYRYLQAQVESIIDPDSADPWPRHFQNFGPSLAVTAELYARAGRLPIVPALEDVRFYEALQRCDARIRHCPRVQVLTSARTQGRVAFGFSVQLQQWEQMRQRGTSFTVPEANYWIFRFTLQRQVRCAWQRKSYTLTQLIARSLMLSPYELYDRMCQTLYFGEFWQWLMSQPTVEALLAQRFSAVDISIAIAGLRHYVQRATPRVPTRRAGTVRYVGGDGASETRWSGLLYETPRAPRPRSRGNS